LQFNSSYVAPGNVGTGRNVLASVRCLADNPLTVEFSGVPATNVTVTDNNDGTQTITAVTPAHAAGLVEVTVDNGLTAFTFPAVWADSGTGITSDESVDNIQSGYLYEELYISLNTKNSDGLANGTVNISGQPDQLLANYLTANVKTNNPTGYNLSIEAAEPRLTCIISSNSYYIQPLTGTGAMVDNRWGYAVGSPNLSPSSWKGLTTNATTIKNFATATDRLDGDDTTVWFGTRVDVSLPACTYNGTVTLTAIMVE
jgi:hypothetical protein